MLNSPFSSVTPPDIFLVLTSVRTTVAYSKGSFVASSTILPVKVTDASVGLCALI